MKLFIRWVNRNLKCTEVQSTCVNKKVTTCLKKRGNILFIQSYLYNKHAKISLFMVDHTHELVLKWVKSNQKFFSTVLLEIFKPSSGL